MTARDWFGVGARLLALWVILGAILYLLGVIDWDVAILRNSTLTDQPTVRSPANLIYGIVELGIGLYLLCYTDHLTRLTYGDSSAGLISNTAENGLHDDRDS